MAIVTVYNRDGSQYGTLNTDEYIFNNDICNLGAITLDANKYPYVKINGTYYVNDGEEFVIKTRSTNSASLMKTTDMYLWNNTTAPDWTCKLQLFDKDWSESGYREVDSEVGTEIPYDTVYMTNFRSGSTDESTHCMYGNQYSVMKLWPSELSKVGLLDGNETEANRNTQYFNMGEAKLLDYNLYSSTEWSLKLTRTDDQLSSRRFDDDVDLNKFDVYLYYVEPLNQKHILHPMGAKLTDGGSLDYDFLDVITALKINDSTEYKSVAYPEAKTYKLSATGDFEFAGVTWTEDKDNIIEWNAIISLTTLTLKIYYQDGGRVPINSKDYCPRISCHLTLDNIPQLRYTDEKHFDTCYINSDTMSVDWYGEQIYWDGNYNSKKPTLYFTGWDTGENYYYPFQSIYRNKQFIVGYENYQPATIEGTSYQVNSACNVDHKGSQDGFYVLLASRK